MTSPNHAAIRRMVAISNAVGGGIGGGGGPQIEYLFDSDATDTSGNNNHGTLAATGVVTAGVYQDGYINIPYSPTQDITSNGTWSYWTKNNSLWTAQIVVVCKESAKDINHAYSIAQGGWRSDLGAKELGIRCQVGGVMKTTKVSIAEPVMAPGRWEHVVITFDKTRSPNFEIWVNATKLVNVVAEDLNVDMTTNTHPEFIRGYYDGIIKLSSGCYLDDYRQYGRTFTDDEVLESYNLRPDLQV